MREKSAAWLKENVRLFSSEAADRELLRVETVSASDSEILRQAVRYLEQYLVDCENGKLLRFIRSNNSSELINIRRFSDEHYDQDNVTRRSLILHDSSKDRLNKIRKDISYPDLSSVARLALRFYHCVVSEAIKGTKFYIIERNGGAATEVRFGGLTAKHRGELDDPPVDAPVPKRRSAHVA